MRARRSDDQEHSGELRQAGGSRPTPDNQSLGNSCSLRPEPVRLPGAGRDPAPRGCLGLQSATKSSPSHKRARTRLETLRYRTAIIPVVPTNIPRHSGVDRGALGSIMPRNRIRTKKKMTSINKTDHQKNTSLYDCYNNYC